jgi:hypothetical protein
VEAGDFARLGMTRFDLGEMVEVARRRQ